MANRKLTWEIGFSANTKELESSIKKAMSALEKVGTGNMPIFMAILFMVIVIALLASVNLRLQFLNENNLQHDYSTQKLETVKEVLEEDNDYAFLEEASESIVGICPLLITSPVPLLFTPAPFLDVTVPLFLYTSPLLELLTP